MQYKIVVDKQPMTNPSSEKKEYIIDIEELRVKGSTHDSLMFEIDKTYVIRRLKLSEYYVLSVLDEPIIEALESINIELFEGDNYIYLIDMQGNKFYAEYLIKNEFNDVFATRKEMNSAIDLTMQQITIAVNQKFTDYSTTEEMNAAIDLRANQINAKVEKKVDEETITGAYLILKINGDTSEEKLNADKIEISANDILNLLAGNTINLTSKNLVLASTNFNVDKNGNMTCSNANISGTVTSNNANITGGSIKVGNNFEVDSTGKMSCNNAKINAYGGSNTGSSDGLNLKVVGDGTYKYSGMAPGYAIIRDSGSTYVELQAGNDSGQELATIQLSANSDTNISMTSLVDTSYISLKGAGGKQTQISDWGIYSASTYTDNVVSNSPNLCIVNPGFFRRTTNTSSQRYKTDIKAIEDEKLNPERLYDLEVKQFKYKKDYFNNSKDSRYDTDLIGFIAEDVAEVYPVAVDYEVDQETGEKIVENWNEKYIIPAMLKLIQNQKAKLDEQQTKIEELEGRILQLEKEAQHEKDTV